MPVQRKDKIFTLRMTTDQVKTLDQRAKKCGVRTSYWVRFILLQVASKDPSDGYMRIREPKGETI